MQTPSSILATCLLGLTLVTASGCANFAGQPEPSRESPATSTEPATPALEEEKRYANFEPEVLYQLLAAEIAGQRGRYEVTLANYAQAARTSGDENVIARTLAIAQSLGNDPVQQQMAELWLQKKPESTDARRVLAVQALKQQNLEAALGHMEALMDRGEDANFDNLAAMATSLPPEQQQEMLELYQQLAERHPGDPELAYSIALLHKMTGESATALERLDTLLAEHPNFQPAVLLKGDLLYQSGRTRQALNYMTAQTRRFPGNLKLGELYGRMLLNENELQAAQDEFQRLLERHPDNPALRLSHALVALENGERALAERELSYLLERDQFVDQASYYLGRIAEDAGRTDQAIGYYQSVEQGNFFFPALARTSAMQAEAGHLNSALTRLRELRQNHPSIAERLWLIEVNLLLEYGSQEQALEAANAALEAYPDNIDVRYSRAMLLDQQDKLAAAEADLNHILQRQPENAVALNALGYILAVRTDRLEEARQYIEKALQLDPGNPAILDSMGWVLFLQGYPEQALDYLEQAWAAFPDPEVAAHYGEALWVTGNRDQARIVWQETLDEHPNDELLLDTINRLTNTGNEE
ncbi:MAG: tetratricopeptide repeat protein [Alteromonadaceae bacterium]|nr:tetratricopeptide repeat protein [Alteromonadaceae bacterium]